MKTVVFFFFSVMLSVTTFAQGKTYGSPNNGSPIYEGPCPPCPPCQESDEGKYRIAVPKHPVTPKKVAGNSTEMNNGNNITIIVGNLDDDSTTKLNEGGLPGYQNLPPMQENPGGNIGIPGLPYNPPPAIGDGVGSHNPPMNWTNAEGWKWLKDALPIAVMLILLFLLAILLKYLGGKLKTSGTAKTSTATTSSTTATRSKHDEGLLSDAMKTGKERGGVTITSFADNGYKISFDQKPVSTPLLPGPEPGTIKEETTVKRDQTVFPQDA